VLKVRGWSRIRSFHLGKKIDFLMSVENELMLAKRLLGQVLDHCHDAIVKERISIFLKRDTRDDATEDGKWVDDGNGIVGDAQEAQ